MASINYKDLSLEDLIKMRNEINSEIDSRATKYQMLKNLFMDHLNTTSVTPPIQTSLINSIEPIELEKKNVKAKETKEEFELSEEDEDNEEIKTIRYICNVCDKDVVDKFGKLTGRAGIYSAFSILKPPQGLGDDDLIEELEEFGEISWLAEISSKGVVEKYCGAYFKSANLKNMLKEYAGNEYLYDLNIVETKNDPTSGLVSFIINDTQELALKDIKFPGRKSTIRFSNYDNNLKIIKVISMPTPETKKILSDKQITIKGKIYSVEEYIPNV